MNVLSEKKIITMIQDSGEKYHYYDTMSVVVIITGFQVLGFLLLCHAFDASTDDP